MLGRAGTKSAARGVVGCDLAAYAGVQVPMESLAEYRRQPGPVPAESPLPSSLLKHADEQTVAGLTAVFQAIAAHGLPGSGYTDWGVLAAPRFFGRPAMAVALQRFQSEGAWGVSPHLIPHRSLHSISGTISQALKIHGPNFGVGGGPGCTTEALLAAFAMLQCQRLPGVWVVLTALAPELPLGPGGQPASGSFCAALALALVPTSSCPARMSLRLVAGDPPCPTEKLCKAHHASEFDLFRLQRLLDAVAQPEPTRSVAANGCNGSGPHPGETTVVQVLEAGSRLELHRTR